MAARRFLITLFALLALAVVFPAPALANMGPPILWMGLGAGFVFVVELVVIVVEWPVLKAFLPVSWLLALGISAVANGVSAVFGALVGSLTIWVLMYARWAGGFGMIGFFFVASTLIETPIVRRLAGRIEWKRALLASASANALSHAVMAALLAWLVLRPGGAGI